MVERRPRSGAADLNQGAYDVMRMLLLVTGTLVVSLPAQSGVVASVPSELRITDAGVQRAAGVVDSVFLQRTHPIDTVAVGDYAAYLLARLGVPPFGDSLAFVVTSDTALVRISGRLADFPAETRAELGPIFRFVDSLAPFVAEIALTNAANGIQRWRLVRVTVNNFAIPALLLDPALREYDRRYPVLASGGREFLVAMPPEATVRLVPDGLELRMPARPGD
ncbi:MAG TPA: hypothetical protein VFN90_02505 [Gemmatimonadales bacterium]|nr:hypothetical protein [Gemmatimonadales bacterium]